MKLNQYQEMARRTAPKEINGKSKANYALGLVCEAGEVGDIVKKEVFHGHSEDREAVRDELGDAFHYLAVTAWLYGWTLQDVAEWNIDKLYKRYPDGFSSERSINRPN